MGENLDIHFKSIESAIEEYEFKLKNAIFSKHSDNIAKYTSRIADLNELKGHIVKIKDRDIFEAMKKECEI
jgi:hypothetical protein